MKPIFFFITIFVLFIFTGCSGPVANSLLVNGSQSCDSLVASCNNLPTNSTTGSLSIQANRAEMTVNMDQSDTVEITGSCVDLDRKKNRILVEVFAGELNESVDPYITNGITSNCYHISGAGMTTSSGINSNDKCFWVTKGIGLIEDIGLPSQKEFPQCHNGEFGFAIKLGKILTDTSLGTNYLVRYKIRTEDGGISDSPWSRVKISRSLSAPKILSTLPSAVSFSCHLQNEVARFNSNLWYNLSRSFNFSGGGSSVSALVPTFANLNSLSPLSYSYDDYNLIEGVTYNYFLTVIDNQYAPYLPSTPIVNSNSIACKAIKPAMVVSGAVPSPGTCMFSLLYFNANPSVSYQIGFTTGAGWTGDPSRPPSITTCSSGTLSTTCTKSGLASGTNYYFAVRSYRDNNPADGVPSLLSEEVGEWSNELSCRAP